MTAAVLAILAGVAHVGFFVLEALLWRRRGVQRLFGARDGAAAQAMAVPMLNLGFYNLFLGIGAIVGAALSLAGTTDALLVYACAFMVGAALVLVARSRAMWRGALVQGALPALALIAVATL